MDLIAQFLVVLMIFFVGFCFGLMIGGMRAAANKPIAPYDEHQADAPYPRIWD